MSDQWINRLVVSGPVGDVRGLARGATGFDAQTLGLPFRNAKKLSLSFRTLYNLLPARARKGVPRVEEEPGDLTCKRLMLGPNGSARKSYSFVLRRYEPDTLFIGISRLFPRLCFILGWVAPNIDEAASKFIKNGKAKRYNMPAKRRGEIRSCKYKEWGEDCLGADWEADWLMLDEVISHWDANLVIPFTGTTPRKTPRIRHSRRMKD